MEIEGAFSDNNEVIDVLFHEHAADVLNNSELQINEHYLIQIMFRAKIRNPFYCRGWKLPSCFKNRRVITQLTIFFICSSELKKYFLSPLHWISLYLIVMFAVKRACISKWLCCYGNCCCYEKSLLPWRWPVCYRILTGVPPHCLHKHRQTPLMNLMTISMLFSGKLN